MHYYTLYPSYATPTRIDTVSSSDYTAVVIDDIAADLIEHDKTIWQTGAYQIINRDANLVFLMSLLNHSTALSGEGYATTVQWNSSEEYLEVHLQHRAFSNLQSAFPLPHSPRRDVTRTDENSTSTSAFCASIISRRPSLPHRRLHSR